MSDNHFVMFVLVVNLGVSLFLMGTVEGMRIELDGLTETSIMSQSRCTQALDNYDMTVKALLDTPAGIKLEVE